MRVREPGGPSGEARVSPLKNNRGLTSLDIWRVGSNRLDHKYRVLMAHQKPIRMELRAYFYRQCLISVDPDESVIAQMIEHLDADYVIWASDYPHINASMSYALAGRRWARARSASIGWRADGKPRAR